jgi:hypothetical protein
LQFAANIPRLFVYTAFKGVGFGLMTAMWVIYLQERRSLTMLFITEIAINEQPTHAKKRESKSP